MVSSSEAHLFPGTSWRNSLQTLTHCQDLIIHSWHLFLIFVVFVSFFLDLVFSFLITCVHTSAVIHRGQKRAAYRDIIYFLELELWVMVSHLTWMFRAGSWSSIRAECALNTEISHMFGPFFILLWQFYMLFLSVSYRTQAILRNSSWTSSSKKTF